MVGEDQESQKKEFIGALEDWGMELWQGVKRKGNRDENGHTKSSSVYFLAAKKGEFATAPKETARKKYHRLGGPDKGETVSSKSANTP